MLTAGRISSPLARFEKRTYDSDSPYCPGDWLCVWYHACKWPAVMFRLEGQHSTLGLATDGCSRKVVEKNCITSPGFFKLLMVYFIQPGVIKKPGKITRLWGFLRLFCTLKRAIDAHEEKMDRKLPPEADNAWCSVVK
jgi:hypothetical protein